MAKSGKGAQAERDLCRRLSFWLSKGKAPLLMWRSPGSGSVSTNANKKGKTPYGMSGDFTATHPYADMLLKEVSIESKRGYGSVSHLDLLDIPTKTKTNIMAGFIEQCQREAEEGNKKYWWLIFQRNRREATITMPLQFILDYHPLFGNFPANSLTIRYNGDKLFVGELDVFLEWFDPEVAFGPFEKE